MHFYFYVKNEERKIHQKLLGVFVHLFINEGHCHLDTCLVLT